MNRLIGFFAFCLLMAEMFSLLPTRVAMSPSEKEASSVPYLKGILHVHSTFSDGGGTVPEIAEGARSSGIDFVILTDHNTTAARREGLEKRYETVDLFVEMEASTPAGHALTFYSDTDDKTLSDTEIAKLAYNHFLGTDTRPGLFVAVAHPSNIKNPWNRLERFPDGLEVINFDSSWQRQAFESIPDFLMTISAMPFNGYLAALRFFQVYPKDFSSWDYMNSLSPGVFGILAHDTHSKLKLNERWVFRWPDYPETFRLASNIVFLKTPPAQDFLERKKQIYSAIRGGQLAFVFQTIFPFEGNDWRLQCQGDTHRAGARVNLTTPCEFIIETPKNLPYPVEIRLIRNGEVHSKIETSDPSVAIKATIPGVYRLEIWVQPRSLLHIALGRDVPYVFYNPMYLK